MGISCCATKELDLSTKTYSKAFAAACVLLSAIFAATHDFAPDYAFRGSSLTGWHRMGHASWRAENGEITGTPQDSGTAVGW